jgi:hypothetical protein
MSRNKNEYRKPKLTEYGAVESLTKQGLNKDGTTEDTYTDATDDIGEPVVGIISSV